MGSACFFAMDSIFHYCPNLDPHTPTKFDNDEGREAAPICDLVSRCWEFICSFTVLNLPYIPG